MSKIKAFFNWPRTEKNPFIYPWWRIVWHILWLPIIVLGVVILCLGVFGQQGYKRAREEWKGLLW